MFGADLEELRLALSAPEPSIPSRFTQDERGVTLLEELARAPEYYVARLEQRLVAAHAARIARTVPARELVDLGGGRGPAVRTLVGALRDAGTLSRCLLFHVEPRVLIESMCALSAETHGLPVVGVTSHDVQDLTALGSGERRLVTLLGNAIGRLGDAAAVGSFLRTLAAHLAPDDALLVGWDIAKDPHAIERAFNDRARVAAAWSRNALCSVNERFAADFDPRGFAHTATFDPDRECVDLCLVAERRMVVSIADAGLRLEFRRGARIRTGVSQSFARSAVRELAGSAGLRVVRMFSDSRPGYALTLLRPAPAPAPARL